VQNVIELEEGKSALKLTTATYTRPNGHNIHRFPDSKETDEWGVKPNDGMEVKLTDREMNNLTADQRQREIAHGKPHAGEMASAAAGEKPADAKSPDAKSGDTKPAASDDHPAETKPSDDTTAKHAVGETTAPPEKISVVANKPAAKANDRQLQKAVDYLTSEMSKNP
jgi:C-terminal processing protease CtpA/Prc